MKNLYEILGIKQNATPEEVKKAYFEMAKKYHPDSGDATELKKFYEISEAYQVLSKTEERRAYDLALKGGKIESILVEEPAPHPTIHRQEVAPDDKDILFRQKEIHQYRRRIFWNGIFRVLGFSIFLAAIGYLFSLVFGGPWWGSIIAGFLVGLPWSVHNNFDVTSFVENPFRRRLLQILGWLVFLGAISYLFFQVFKFSDFLLS